MSELLNEVRSYYPNAVRAFLTETEREDLGFIVPTIENEVPRIMVVGEMTYEFAVIRIDMSGRDLVVYYRPID
jgi:hypothetical protein